MKVLSLALWLLCALPADALAGDWIVWRGSRIGSYLVDWSPLTEFPSSEECERARPRFTAAAAALLEANRADYSDVKVNRGRITARLTRPMLRLNESMPLIYPSLNVWFECWPAAGTQPER